MLTRYHNFLYNLLIFFLFICVGLLITGRGVLVYEHKVNPGANYLVEDYGNLGKSEQPSLVCKYFIGRKFITEIFWYSPNNILGRNSCPFIYKIQE